ncbi:MAG: phosphate ABC transporter permease subunit PstC, partial [Gemmatimonadota bacterium]
MNTTDPGGSGLATDPEVQPPDLSHRAGRRWGERLIVIGLFLCGLVSVLTTGGIVVVLVTESAGFFREVPLFEFLTGTRWSPLFADQH